ncbi:MAG: hypothetical protein GXN99_00810 [Candidatus Nanohaloarchaeota archaeon]|nr:hypothetical protein [Candidatus Nanohaloarchaeota archaeon]
MGVMALLGISMFVIGLLIIYLLFYLPLKDEGFYIGFAIAILMLSVGTYLIYVNLPLTLILRKAAGLVLIYIGYWFVFVFPDAIEIQAEGQSLLGIIIGVLSFIWGLYFLMF